jgi:hypothetical protein
MSFVSSLDEHWPDGAPDWIVVLASEADATSQKQVATRLGRSGPLVSQVLRNRYTGDLAVCEELVRGILMDTTLECPSLGDIAVNECRDWRKKSEKWVSVNALRSRMFRACNRCPKNGKGNLK